MRNGKFTPHITSTVNKNAEEQLEHIVWDKQSVKKAKELIEAGKVVKQHPFFESTDPTWRRSNINYRMSPEEYIEYCKCALDVNYFSNKYAYSMTDEGIKKITLRDYQSQILKKFQSNREVVFLASRQIGKCVSPDTIIMVFDPFKNKYKESAIGELYYQNQRGFIPFVKKNLYKILRWLS